MNDIFNRANSMDLTGGASMEKTSITKDTVLIGTIAADSSIIIDGGVRGDVYSKNSIELKGKVDGNIKANDISISDGAVKGDISSEGNILVSGDSVIVGNLFGSSLEFNGKIKGNVRINGHAIIRENAIIHGNLSACNFTVDDGAKIIGFVEILRPVDVSGQITEKIEDIVDFNDIEIPEDAGVPDASINEVVEAAAEASPTPTPLFSTVSSSKEEEPVVVAPIEPVAVDEKQKMLQDLRSRMERAKKSGQSL